MCVEKKQGNLYTMFVHVGSCVGNYHTIYSSDVINKGMAKIC